MTTKTFDLHGYTTTEALSFLQNLEKTDKTTKSFHFITGKGKHTKNRPIMEPFLENTWKCPLKKTVLDFGSRILLTIRIHTGRSNKEIQSLPTIVYSCDRSLYDL